MVIVKISKPQCALEAGIWWRGAGRGKRVFEAKSRAGFIDSRFSA